jgi:hypothetical protein
VHSSRENGASYRKGPDVGYHKFDALIITALLDELEAVLALGEGRKEAWTTERDPAGFPFHHREFPREVGGEPLRIAAASFDQMGGLPTVTRATTLINHLNPACADARILSGNTGVSGARPGQSSPGARRSVWN